MNIKRLILSFIVLFALNFSASFADEYFWEKVNGPYGASINSIIYDEQNDIIYLATKSDGVYFSSDKAENWESLNNADLPKNSWVNDVLINDNGDIYAVTDSLGILIKEVGKKWRVINSGLGGHLRLKSIIAIDDFLLIGSLGKALFKSINGGKTWFNINLGLDSKENVNCIIQIDNSKILIGTDNGLYKSQDDAGSWDKINTDIGNVHFLLKINNDFEIIAATSKGVYVSYDNASTWSSRNDGFQNKTNIQSLCIVDSILYAGTEEDGVFKSNINNFSWLPFSLGLESLNVPSLLSTPDGRIYAGTNSSILNSSSEDSSWKQKNNGLGQRIVNNFAATNEKGLLFAATDLGVHFTTDNGDSWKQINRGLDEDLNISTFIILSDGSFLAGTLGSGLFLSTDNGINWVRLLSFAPAYINSIVQTMSGKILVGTRDNGVYQSDDFGVLWYPMYGGGIDSYNILSLQVDSSDYIYAGTKENGLFRFSSEIFEWQKVDNLEFPIDYVTAMASKKDEESSYVFAASNLGILRTIDNGNYWIDANGHHPEILLNPALSLSVSNLGVIYAGLKNVNGVFYSTNNGDQWLKIQDLSGISNYEVKTLGINSWGYLFAGTINGGCFRSISSVEGKDYQPYILALNPTEFCNGGFCVLDAGEGYSSYLWSNGNTDRFDTIRASGSYWFSVKDSTGLQAFSDTLTITVWQIPAEPVIEYNGVYLECFADVEFHSWTLNGEIIDSANSQIFFPKEDGIYQCEITDDNGCKNISDTLSVHIESTNVATITNSNSIILFPNPNNGTFQFEFSTKSNIPVYYSIHDIFGRTIFESNIDVNINKQITEVNLTNQVSGSYFLRVFAAGKIHLKMIIIE